MVGRAAEKREIEGRTAGRVSAEPLTHCEASARPSHDKKKKPSLPFLESGLHRGASGRMLASATPSESFEKLTCFSS